MPRRRQPSTGRQAMQGFSLVELVVTVIVLGVLAAIAVPRFAELTNRSRISSATNEMVALLQTARSAAITNRSTVTVCPSTGSACQAAMGARWIALSSKAGVLRETTFNSAITVKASANLAGASNKFTFTPNGFSAVGTQTVGKIGFCSPKVSGQNRTDVTVNFGRISTTRATGTASCTAPVDN